MAFPQSVVDAAWKRAEGRCECTRKAHGHEGVQCNRKLPPWRTHHRTAVSSSGDDTLSNCEALCVPCHEKTGTYGG
jgi:5-methylcytosine-specific restriction endonuclease McrA